MAQEYLPAAGDRIGGFMLLEPLGRGAMGQVYRAKDETLGREVAIKFIDLSELKNEYLINEVKKRFIREARLLAAINHPNVVEIYSASLEFRCPYIVMQFFDGKPLFEYQDEVGVIDHKRCAVISLQICEALDYCWENYEVMHRDLKPANVMISKAGHIKIIDWGIAKVTKDLTMGVSLATRSDMRLGTPHFMAPEQQINPGEVTYLADIYSMGMIMWQMLVGTLPFDAGSEAVIFSQKQKGPERNLTRLIPELPEAIAELIYLMLEPKPEKRISSYAEIRNTLQREINSFEDKDDLFPKAERPRVVLKPLPQVTPPQAFEPPPPAQAPAQGVPLPQGLETNHQMPTEGNDRLQTDKREKKLVILRQPEEAVPVAPLLPEDDDDVELPVVESNFLADCNFQLVDLPDSQAVDAEFWPGKEIGRYKLIQRIGMGSMGVVMRAEDQQAGGEVAMKFLVCDPTDLRNRLDEVRHADSVVSALRHNAIAKIIQNTNIEGYNITISNLYLGSEGRPINLWDCSRLYGNEEGILNQYDIRSMLLTLLEALTHAHSHSMVHCDLKPENILFPTQNGSRRKWYSGLKVSDFGIAHIVGEDFRHKSIRRSLRYANVSSAMKEDIRSLVNTFDFMSPEQRRGKTATPLSDVYSVGLIALRFLTGNKQLKMHKRPSTSRSGIDPAWDHVLLRALKEAPKERYQSAAEMAADIANLPF